MGLATFAATHPLVRNNQFLSRIELPRLWIYLGTTGITLTHLIFNKVKSANPYVHSSLVFRVAFSHGNALQFIVISDENSKYFTGHIAPEWKAGYRDTGPVDIDTEPPKVSKNTSYFPWLLVIVLAISGFHLLYGYIQRRLDDQNKLSEFENRLLIIDKVRSQKNQMRKINQKIKPINEDSSKSSIDDQPRKEEQHYVVQQGDIIFKISSKNKITIRELKVINEISSAEAISPVQKLD